MSTFSESILQTSTTDNSSIFSSADSSSSSSGTNWILWIILALLAAFLGFALYNYLGADWSRWFPQQSSVQPSAQPSVEQSSVQPSVNEQSLQRTLQEKAPAKEPDVEADTANSSIQGGGKSGWCFIGEDRGFRSCAQVGVNDECMSGEIFPSQEICMNPSLRA